VTADGRTVVVTGYSWGVGAKTDHATIAYNATSGTMRWAKRYFGTPGYSGDNPGSAGPQPGRQHDLRHRW